MRFGVGVAVAAVGLGLLAFVADLVEGIGGDVLVALTSSGFAWGLAAFLVGRAAASQRMAAMGGGALLVSATLLYYLLVVLVSRRWSGGVLDDGRSADLHGLRSVAIMTGVWLVGSIVAGPLLALLGHAVRTGPAARSALAAGVACGLLSGEGWYTVWRAPLWRLDYHDPYSAEFAWGLALSEVARLVLPLAVLLWLTVVHRLGQAWATLVAATITAAATSALLWYAVHRVPS
jgi:hypothetical protein